MLHGSISCCALICIGGLRSFRASRRRLRGAGAAGGSHVHYCIACCICGPGPEHVPSVVGGAMHMLCPDEIGRDVWDRVGRASVGWQVVNSPHRMGEETLADV